MWKHYLQKVWREYRLGDDYKNYTFKADEEQKQINQSGVAMLETHILYGSSDNQ